jgi:hypothetical protein
MWRDLGDNLLKWAEMDDFDFGRNCAPDTLCSLRHLEIASEHWRKSLGLGSVVAFEWKPQLAHS